MNKQQLPFSEDDYFKMLDEMLTQPPVSPNPQLALQRFIEQRKAGGNGQGKLITGLK